MSTFAELHDRLRIAIAAPDGTVEVRYDAGTANIVLAPDCPKRHTERSLGAVVDQCLESLSRAYDTATERIRGRVYGAERGDLVVDERLARYQAELASVQVKGVSPRGFVTMEQSGGRVSTDIAPRTLMRCNTGDLAAELNGALAEVSNQYGAAVVTAYTREYFNVEVAKLPPWDG